MIRVPHQAAGHLHRLLCLGLVIKIDGRKGQQQGPERCAGIPCAGRIQQRQLAGGMLEPCDDLLDVLVEHFAVASITQSLLLAQLAECQCSGGKGQQQEGAAKEDPQPERNASGPPGHQGMTQRNPRMGTLSMLSNSGSTSLNASRIVPTCLRTLSRLRPLFTAWKSSSYDTTLPRFSYSAARIR